jgi:predicted nucleic acid-binding protein
VSRVYLDANFLFGLVRQRDGHGSTGFSAWRERVQAAAAEDPPAVSGLVIDEVTYRLVLSWLRDAGDAEPLTTYRREGRAVMRRMRQPLGWLWKALDRLDADVVPTDRSVVQLAQGLMSDPGLAPRDAFHAAHAIGGRCRWLVSSDPAFDLQDRVERLGPEPMASR